MSYFTEEINHGLVKPPFNSDVGLFQEAIDR